MDGDKGVQTDSGFVTEGVYLDDENSPKSLCVNRTPEDEAMFKDISGVLNNIINSELKDKEKNILIYRFGLDGKEPGSLYEIARAFKMTLEGIRKIINKSLVKIKRRIGKMEISKDDIKYYSER